LQVGAMMASHFKLTSKFANSCSFVGRLVGQGKGQGDDKMGCNGGEAMIPWQ